MSEESPPLFEKVSMLACNRNHISTSVYYDLLIDAVEKCGDGEAIRIVPVEGRDDRRNKEIVRQAMIARGLGKKYYVFTGQDGKTYMCKRTGES